MHVVSTESSVSPDKVVFVPCLWRLTSLGGAEVAKNGLLGIKPVPAAAAVEPQTEHRLGGVGAVGAWPLFVMHLRLLCPLAQPLPVFVFV